MDERSVQRAHPRPSRDYSRLATTAFSRDHTAITALVVGAGALGNEVIKNLALVGVERLWIADRDRVEASNLTRSILFCIPDIGDQIERGTPKAVLAARRVREINPDVSVTPYVGEIADLGYGVIRRADVIFSCVDNEMARLELSWACSRLRKTLIDGGLGLMNYSSGQVSIFPKEHGPCYACRKGADRRRQLLQELQGREDPCWRKNEAIEAAEGVATTPLMASVVAAFQVELGLRALQAVDADAVGRAYRITLYPTPSLEPIVFERSPTCPLHDSASIVRTVRECPEARSDRWTPSDLLRQSGRIDGYLAFDWPMTSKARCRSCGHEWEPLVRRARFRRQGCPGCGNLDVVETEVLSGVRATSPWAERTLAELGLPRGHVYETIQDDDVETERVHVEVTGDLLDADADEGHPC
jgi:molybdopterin/thiamine biosynthesis adenylyltransferase